MRKKSVEEIVRQIVVILQRNPRLKEARHSNSPQFKKYQELREELREKDPETYRTESYLYDVGNM
ncbi:hypothetical protein HZA33_01410 [Candidatus Pacearchaeota archaeon]|nr:hypothetical protein [Candidatus Pacearchaeota archaeon]